MTSGIGSIRGTIRIDAKQALAEYAAVRRANGQTRAALTSASGTFAKVGVGALAAAAPIALLFKKAVTGAADFQKKIDYFGAVTGATKQDMQDVADYAIKMSRTTVYSAQDMADAFVEFGKAGISTKDIINGVAQATVNLAQAADISTAEASNIMASQLATFKLGAKDASHVANVLAGAANASIIDIQDMAYSLKYAGGIAASIGVSFDSVSTAIALLGQRGIRGSTAGTSLRQIMVSLVGPTKAAKKEMKTLGLITKDGTNLFIDQHGKLKSLSAVFQILQDKEKGLTQAQQLAANKTLFNSRALSAVQILMRDGSKGFADMSAKMNKVSASDVARKRLNNLAGDWQKFKNSIQTTLIQVGGPLQSFFRTVVKGLTGMVNWFGRLSPHTQKMIIYGLGLVGMFLALTGILSLGISVVLKVIGVWKDVMAAFKLVRGAITIVMTAMRALGIAMMTNPMFLLIAAVIAVVAALVILWFKCKAFRDFVKKVWAAIVAGAKWLWKELKAAFNWIIRGLKDLGHWFMVAFHAVSDAISWVINFVKKHWKAIIAWILGPIGLVIDAIVTHWKSIMAFLKMVWNGIKVAAVAIWDGIKWYFQNVIMGIFNFFYNIFTKIATFLKNIFTPVFNLFKAIWSKTFSVLKTIITSIYHVVKSIFTKVWSFTFSIAGRIFRAIKSIFTPLGRVVASMATSVWNGCKHIYDTIINFFSKAGTWLYDAGKWIIEGIWNGIQGMSSWIWDKVSGFMGNLWNNVLDFFGIGSPAKKGIDAGKWIVHGLAKGISMHQRTAVAAVNSLNKAVQGAGSPTIGANLAQNRAMLKKSMLASARASIAGANTSGSGSSAMINNLNVTAQPGEKLTSSIPRALRKASFIVGPAR